MPKFKKSRGYVQKNNPFKMYKSPATMTGSPLHQAKGDDSLMEDFVPAFPGADISEEEYKKKQKPEYKADPPVGDYVTYETPLYNESGKRVKIAEENTGEIKKDKGGRKYVTVLDDSKNAAAGTKLYLSKS